MKKIKLISIFAALTTIVACNEAEPWTSTCQENETRCDGSTLMICTYGDWTIESNCMDQNKMCGKDDNDKPACIEIHQNTIVNPEQTQKGCAPTCVDGVCTCADGYVNVSGECQIQRTCDTYREKYDSATNTCACDTDKFWTGTAGSCVCESGKVQVGNACEAVNSCDGEGQIYIERANMCLCDSAKGWISDGEVCKCPEKYIAIEGECVLKAECDVEKENYNSETNSCACADDRNWSGTAGACICKDDMIQMGDACIKMSVGGTIEFGHYEQDGNLENGKEPITWRILDKNDNNQYLLTSEYVLDAVPFNTTQIAILWENSTIRSWLNGYDGSYNTVGTSYIDDNFIDTAFSEAEQENIFKALVPSHDNSEYSTTLGNDTNDKIFLLSAKEVDQYLKDEKSGRAPDATKYAIQQFLQVFGTVSLKKTNDGSCTDSHCRGVWWLRSINKYYNVYPQCATYVEYGAIRNDGDWVDNAHFGIRPAIWVEF